jgi:hypothetical protein
MANMTHYKYRTYLTFTEIRRFELVIEPQIWITIFIDYIHDNTFSDAPIRRDLSALSRDAGDSSPLRRDALSLFHLTSLSWRRQHWQPSNWTHNLNCRQTQLKSDLHYCLKTQSWLCSHQEFLHGEWRYCSTHSYNRRYVEARRKLNEPTAPF